MQYETRMSCGLVKGHAYSVTAVEEVRTVLFLHLWGAVVYTSLTPCMSAKLWGRKKQNKLCAKEKILCSNKWKPCGVSKPSKFWLCGEADTTPLGQNWWEPATSWSYSLPTPTPIMSGRTTAQESTIRAGISDLTGQTFPFEPTLCLLLLCSFWIRQHLKGKKYAW